MEFYAIKVHNMSLGKMWGDLTFDKAKQTLIDAIKEQNNEHYLENMHEIENSLDNAMEYYFEEDADNQYLFAIGACE